MECNAAVVIATPFLLSTVRVVITASMTQGHKYMNVDKRDQTLKLIVSGYYQINLCYEFLLRQLSHKTSNLVALRGEFMNI
uniref:Uncharacterized protein n=1 Tax=Glossina palpalis gambiensis TaxID=67801 RepID=A0A1B0BKS3_9MUSC